MAFQNPHPIENSLNKLRVMYELGLRVMQMTYNKSNYIGTGCTESTDSGLTDFGREEMAAAILSNYNLTVSLRSPKSQLRRHISNIKYQPILFISYLK